MDHSLQAPPSVMGYMGRLAERRRAAPVPRRDDFGHEEVVHFSARTRDPLQQRLASQYRALRYTRYSCDRPWEMKGPVAKVLSLFQRMAVGQQPKWEEDWASFDAYKSTRYFVLTQGGRFKAGLAVVVRPTALRRYAQASADISMEIVRAVAHNNCLECLIPLFGLGAREMILQGHSCAGAQMRREMQVFLKRKLGVSVCPFPGEVMKRSSSQRPIAEFPWVWFPLEEVEAGARRAMRG